MSNAEKVLHGEEKASDVAFFVDAPAINKDTVQKYIDFYTSTGEITSDGKVAK